jgi:hypothetical protein
MLGKEISYLKLEMHNQTIFAAEKMNEKLHKYVENVRLIALVLSNEWSYISRTVLKIRASLGMTTESQVAVEYTY